MKHLAFAALVFLIANSSWANKEVRIRLLSNQPSISISGDIVSISKNENDLPILISQRDETVRITFDDLGDEARWRIQNKTKTLITK